MSAVLVGVFFLAMGLVALAVARPRRFHPCGFYLPLEAAMAAILFAAA